VTPRYTSDGPGVKIAEPHLMSAACNGVCTESEPDGQHVLARILGVSEDIRVRDRD